MKLQNQSCSVSSHTLKTVSSHETPKSIMWHWCVPWEHDTGEDVTAHFTQLHASLHIFPRNSNNNNKSLASPYFPMLHWHDLSIHQLACIFKRKWTWRSIMFLNFFIYSCSCSWMIRTWTTVNLDGITYHSFWHNSHSNHKMLKVPQKRTSNMVEMFMAPIWTLSFIRNALTLSRVKKAIYIDMHWSITNTSLIVYKTATKIIHVYVHRNDNKLISFTHHSDCKEKSDPNKTNSKGWMSHSVTSKLRLKCEVHCDCERLFKDSNVNVQHTHTHIPVNPHSWPV